MYLLDANVFITAKNLQYGFDFASGFWEWLDKGHAHGILCSTEHVRHELLAGPDELSEWAKQRESFFYPPNPAVIPSMQRLATWARSGRFHSTAADEFLRVADFQLVAHAHAFNFTVVTHERPNPLAKKRILIPDACQELGVPWTDPYSMLRSAGIRLVLDRNGTS